jgi:hypothetical protein
MMHETCLAAITLFIENWPLLRRPHHAHLCFLMTFVFAICKKVQLDCLKFSVKFHLNVFLWNKSSFYLFQITLLVCSSPFTLVSPTSFYPYCYQINQQSSLVSQLNAIQDCSDKSAQLVWFQSIDEIQQQLIPALFARGLARGLLLGVSF